MSHTKTIYPVMSYDFVSLCFCPVVKETETSSVAFNKYISFKIPGGQISEQNIVYIHMHMD